MKNMQRYFVVLFILMLVGIVYLAMQMGQKSPLILEGSLKISADLKNEVFGSKTFFLIIYDESNPAPMPYGVYRDIVQISPDSTIDFTITKENLQVIDRGMGASSLPSMLKVKVRLDADGSAGPDQPGDFISSQDPKLVPPGTQGLQFIIDRKV